MGTAMQHTLVFPLTHLFHPVIAVNQALKHNDFLGINSSYTVTREDLDRIHLHRLEQVTVCVNIKHERRGAVRVRLVSPGGIVSELAPGRPQDTSAEG